MVVIQYDVRWSNDVDGKFRTDFLKVQKEVFNCGSIDEYTRQYDKNPYGRSVLVVAYLNDKPIGARSLWRNDINGIESYQPGSTCVSSTCRGMGVFKEMTLKALSLVPSNALIYNFPNPNSYPGYMKMGWKLKVDYSVRLFLSYKEYKKEHPVMMDDEYARWWVLGKSLYSVKIGDHYFLAHRDHRPLCCRIFAEVNDVIAQQFPRVKHCLFFYRSSKCPWYSTKFLKSHVVYRNSDVEYIPTWKIDAI